MLLQWTCFCFFFFPITSSIFSFVAEYLSFPPVFHNPGRPETIMLNESSNARFLCNASTSRNASLEWRWLRNGATLPIPISNCSSSSITSGAPPSGTCEQCSPASMFSIPVGHTEIRHYTADNEATIVLQQLELILCDVQANISGAYFCTASDSSRESPPLKISVDGVPTSDNSNIITIAIAVPLIVVLTVVLATLILAFGCWRYRSFKSEALPMSPIQSFPLHSFTNPALLLQMASIEDPLEFPRDRLTFVRVVGEQRRGFTYKY